MKAGIVFTGTGPILFLTSYNSFSDPALIHKLKSKGIKKFIAFEIPVERVREKYGTHFETTLVDLKQEDDLRVVDYDGHHILLEFSWKDLSNPFYYE
ncbi:MAG TPA: hypothetical protein PK595_02155 [Bacteroidota bacterium]|jgi:hypothetical protein|nr:hypothetical protein [Bacteroidota bacterium]